MLDHIPRLIFVQGVFRGITPWSLLAARLATPIAYLARIYLHGELIERRGRSLSMVGADTLVGFLGNWVSKKAGLQEFYKTYARALDISVCALHLKTELEHLATLINHCFNITLYGTSTLVAIDKVAADIDSQTRQPTFSERLSSVTKRCLLALGDLYLAMESETSSYFVVSNSYHIWSTLHDPRMPSYARFISPEFAAKLPDIKVKVSELNEVSNGRVAEITPGATTPLSLVPTDQRQHVAVAAVGMASDAIPVLPLGVTQSKLWPF